jgi:UPF0271 protein
MRKFIDLNCDMGESYYDKIIGNDEKILPYITSCNIACGFHGGDSETISKTILLAIQNNVKIGAHPSFHDIEGFGRRKYTLKSKELESILLYQISALKGMAESFGAKLNHVKPHGALYNMASIDLKIAEIIVKSIKKVDPNLILYGPSMNKWKELSENHGIKYLSEVFSDRNYNDDLSLVDRKLSNAMITDPGLSLEHINNMIEKGKVKTITGKLENIELDTICVHGDQPNALLFAKTLHKSLKYRGLI